APPAAAGPSRTAAAIHAAARPPNPEFARSAGNRPAGPGPTNHRGKTERPDSPEPASFRSAPGVQGRGRRRRCGGPVCRSAAVRSAAVAVAGRLDLFDGPDLDRHGSPLSRRFTDSVELK